MYLHVASTCDPIRSGMDGQLIRSDADDFRSDGYEVSIDDCVKTVLFQGQIVNPKASTEFVTNLYSFTLAVGA